MTARAKYDAASAHALAMRDIAGKLRALIVALGYDGTRLAAAYREVAAAEAALADDAAKAYADVPRAPTTNADRERVVREVRGVLADQLDAGVISDMERPIVLSPTDADRVAALIEERPGPTEAMRALFAERRPCAGWVATEIGSLVLRRSDGVGSHAVVHGQVWRTATACGSAPTIEAAQLAAEDALRAIAAEILRVVGS